MSIEEAQEVWLACMSGFLSRDISSALTTRFAIEAISFGQSMHVCMDSLALNTGRCFAGSQTNVVSEASAWQREICRRMSIQWSKVLRTSVWLSRALGREGKERKGGLI